MQGHSSAQTGRFRLLLVVGAAVSIAIGVWGVVWIQMLNTVLGIDVSGSASGAGAARLYGGVMIAIGIGYALGAAQPHRNRGLLVPLFAVPLITAIVAIGAAARQEITGGKAYAFAAYNLVYCLFYFRLYPRVGPEPPRTFDNGAPPVTGENR